MVGILLYCELVRHRTTVSKQLVLYSLIIYISHQRTFRWGITAWSCTWLEDEQIFQRVLMWLKNLAINHFIFPHTEVCVTIMQLNGSRGSWTPSTVEPRTRPAQVSRRSYFESIIHSYWILQRVRESTSKSGPLLILEMEFFILHSLQEWKSQ